MMNNSQLGQLGEQVAERYLRVHGYRIVERNYRYKRAEVDLIVAKEKVLVLVEVKTRSTHHHGFPEEAVTSKKETLLLSAAEHYIEQQQWQYDVRFDIISILWENGQAQVMHIEDAFH